MNLRMDRRILIIVLVLAVLVMSAHTATSGFGESKSSCGDPNGTGLHGCMNFTMWPGETKVESWTIINGFDYNMSYYIAAPYYGNSSEVPNVTYAVPCLAGHYINTTSYNTTLKRNITTYTQITCNIPANTNATVYVEVTLSANVPINETWGGCTSCLTVAYASQARNATGNSNSTGINVGYGTAKRILITVIPKPKPVRIIIPPSGAGTKNNTNTSNTSIPKTPTLGYVVTRDDLAISLLIVAFLSASAYAFSVRRKMSLARKTAKRQKAKKTKTTRTTGKKQKAKKTKPLKKARRRSKSKK